MKHHFTRRAFLKQSALTAAGTALWGGCRTGPRKLSANERLNIAVIGTANRAAENINEITRQNIVALCDVDENFLAARSREFPAARTWRDWRRMLEQKDIDAVLVATPDHTHAVATVAALQSGRHVYCEKPLTHTVSEARLVAGTARRHRLATQMGNQIHASDNFRRVVELIQSGAIGTVSEVHVWVAAVYGNVERPKESPPVPLHLNYDLWLGPVEYRPYHPDYLPFKWRNWWAFGGGTVADFGCHYLDLPHWALGLRHPLTVEVVDGPPVHPEAAPPWLKLRYRYGERGAQPPVNLFWYHGGKRPAQLDPDTAAKWKSGVLFVGARGSLLADYTRRVLLPEKDFAGFVPPTLFIADSAGHHEEWIRACKTGSPTLSNFDYAGALTEAALLGNVAYRAGKKIEWDPVNLRAVNCPAAEEFIQHHYRRGWTLA